MTEKKKRPVYGTATTNVNLREEPEKDADILYVVKKDEVVTVDINGSTDTFYKVYINGLIGYCVKEFIKL